MALRKRFSFNGFAMVLRSGLLPWNEPAHAKVWQCTVSIRASLTSDLTYSDVHDASSPAMPGTMTQARTRAVTMRTSRERILSLATHATASGVLERVADYQAPAREHARRADRSRAAALLQHRAPAA